MLKSAYNYVHYFCLQFGAVNKFCIFSSGSDDIMNTRCYSLLIENLGFFRFITLVVPVRIYPRLYFP
jgi:hypothetical protein